LKIFQDVPAVAESGDPFAFAVQILAKLDDSFGWYDSKQAEVTLALFRRQFEYNTPAPLTGTLTAKVDLDGILHFTVLQVAEISGDLLRTERVFFLIRCSLLVHGVDVGLSSIQSPYFLAKPGQPSRIHPKSNLKPSTTAGLVNMLLGASNMSTVDGIASSELSIAKSGRHSVPVSLKLYMTDKNRNLVKFPSVTIFATALLTEPLPAACSGEALANVVSALSVGNATSHVCLVNMLLGASNMTTVDGIASFELSIAKSGRHSVVFWSPG
jgi:hypothetical protein